MAKSAFRMIWRQAAVEHHVTEATKAGINDTMRACVATAKQLAPVETGALRDDIAMREAEVHGTRITGRWGNWEIPYAIFQEYGTHTIRPKYYLTQAKDRHYPSTALNIKAHM